MSKLDYKEFSNFVNVTIKILDALKKGEMLAATFNALFSLSFGKAIFHYKVEK